MIVLPSILAGRRQCRRAPSWVVGTVLVVLSIATHPACFAGDLPLGRPNTNPPIDAAASDASQFDSLLKTDLIRLETKPRPPAEPKNFQQQIDTARHLRRAKDNASARKMLVSMLETELPAEFKRAALLELALVAQDEKQFPRAQQILAHYAQLFPQDATLPDVLLRQGLIFRRMGAHQMAISKFYAVMSTALTLKLEHFDYYKRLVLRAQIEIAETFYLQGKYPEAADFFGRILKQDAIELNRTQIHFRRIRSLANLDRHAEVVAQCEAFFETDPDVAELAELRFLCASSLTQLGRGQEALVQVLKLLQVEEGTAQSNPENWVYWQQRAGNEIANQLYREGDYVNALRIYTHLAQLNDDPAWQLPAKYQVGLIYERLGQPEKAIEAYDAILGRQKELTGSADNPNLKMVFEMAKWRKEQIHWQGQAEVAVQSLHLSAIPFSAANRGRRSTP